MSMSILKINKTYFFLIKKKLECLECLEYIDIETELICQSVLNLVEVNLFLMKTMICTFVGCCLHISRQNLTFVLNLVEVNLFFDENNVCTNVAVCIFVGEMFAQNVVVCTFVGFCTFHGSTVPCNAINQHKQRLLGQNQFDMVY